MLTTARYSMGSPRRCPETWQAFNIPQNACRVGDRLPSSRSGKEEVSALWILTGLFTGLPHYSLERVWKQGDQGVSLESSQLAHFVYHQLTSYGDVQYPCLAVRIPTGHSPRTRFQL